MNRRNWLVVIVAVILAVLAGTLAYETILSSGGGSPASSNLPGPPGAAVCSPSSGNWTTYHQNNARAGVGPGSHIASVHGTWTGSVGVDGSVYAEPLVCGNAVFVATEANSVYAINVSDGAILWKTSLGTPVASNTLPCGDIGPTSGISGTPVIDVATGTLYAVAFLSSGQHVLFGLNAANGSIVSRTAADPPGSDPSVEQQRGALALANGFVYVVYGGLWGDCGNYHGWVVGIPTSSPGSMVSYEVPTVREGGIWGTAGMAVSAGGDLYVSTGNGANSTTFDHGDSVIELSPRLSEVGYFAPSNWAQLNSQDTDLGSVAPTLLPNGDLFQVGKEGVGYLLSGTALGGIGGQLANVSVCGGAYGGTAHLGLSVFVPCLDGLFDVVAGASGLSVAWQTSSFDSGSPIVTGDVVWAVDVSHARLIGFNISDGQQRFSFSLASAEHFISPAAGPSDLYVAGGNQVYAFALS